MRDDPVLHIIVPETEVNEVTQQPWADDLEFSSEHTTGVDVAGVRLEALVPSEDLRS